MRNPDAVSGQVFTLVSLITQMDAATGPCNFRGYWDNVSHAYSYQYAGDNAMFSPTPTVSSGSVCPILDGIDQDDTVRLVVRSQGSLTYDTQIGGSTSVPLFQILRVDEVIKG